MKSPALSVIVMVDQQPRRCERALQSLLEQESDYLFEVVLLDFRKTGSPSLRGSEDSRVRRINCRLDLGFGRALAQGVLRTRAPVVAFLEEHAVAEPGWIDALVRAHQGPWAAVGPEVACDNPESRTSRLIDLISFGPWSAPAVRSEPSQLRWQNVSYKKSALARYSDRLDLLFNAEGTLFELLRADGDRLLLEPSARIRHSNENEFSPFLRGNFLSNRLSMASRARLLRLNLFQRVVRVANAVLTPLRLTARLYLQVHRSSRPDLKREFWRSLPWLLIYYTVLAAAVQVGLMLGPGRSAVEFLAYELNQPRGIADLEEFSWLAAPAAGAGEGESHA